MKHILFVALIAWIGTIVWVGETVRTEHKRKDAQFQKYLVDHHCKRTGFAPSGKEVASVYTCDNGVWLASEIWNAGR